MKLSKKSQKVLLPELEADLQEIEGKRAKLVLNVMGVSSWNHTTYNGQIMYIEKLIKKVKGLPF